MDQSPAVFEGAAVSEAASDGPPLAWIFGDAARLAAELERKKKRNRTAQFLKGIFGR